MGGCIQSVEATGHALPQLSTDTSLDLGVVFGTICDTDSLHFVMFGRSTETVHRALSVHGIPYDGLSYDLCHQALCHHLLNGLCTRCYVLLLLAPVVQKCLLKLFPGPSIRTLGFL